MAKFQYQIVEESLNPDGCVSERRVLETSTRKREIEVRFNRWLYYMKKSEHYGSPIRRNSGWAECCFYGECTTQYFELFICKVAI